MKEAIKLHCNLLVKFHGARKKSFAALDTNSTTYGQQSIFFGSGATCNVNNDVEFPIKFISGIFLQVSSSESPVNPLQPYSTTCVLITGRYANILCRYYTTGAHYGHNK